MSKAKETTIKVCVKGKKCRKRGGPDVHKRMEEAADAVKNGPRVKGTDCLGLCKHAPAVEVKPDGIEYGAVRPGDAEDIVEAVCCGKQVDRLVVKKKKKK